MKLGLKRGMVELADHDPQWEVIAADTIQRLWRIFGDVAKDIQHVGSTAIKTIKAKPIIDIAVAVDSFDEVEALMPALNQNGWSKSVLHAIKDDMLIVDDDVLADTRTHHVHIVIDGSVQWKNYICFRDYLNSNDIAANKYNSTKQILAKKYPNDRNAYTKGKDEIVAATLQEARIWDDFDRKFTKIEPIAKGWSGDKKYYIETDSNERLVLRIAKISEYDRKKIEYGAICKAAALGLYTPQPKGFGVLDNKTRVYYLVTWLDGDDVASNMATMTEIQKYSLGLRAGELL